MSLIGQRIVKYVGGLRFPYLVAATATLFVVNLVVPDLLPYVDEVLLALVTLILSRVKRRSDMGVGTAGSPGTPLPRK